MVFTEEALTQSKAFLDQAKSVVIISHKSPDGDSVGSSLGLYSVLKQTHEVSVVVPDAFPDFLDWMEGRDTICVADQNPEEAKRLFETCDLIFVLDFNASSRVGGLTNILANAEAPKVMIDHHRDPEDFCQVMFSDPEASSTAELVFQFIDKLGRKDELSAGGASALYCGLMTDTGSFKFASTSSRTHRIVAELIDKGASNSEIHRLVYDNSSIHRLKLLGFALHKMEVFPEHEVAYIALTAKELRRFHAQKGDTEGIVNYALSMKGIRMAAFFKEDQGLIKISFRSKGERYVNEFSRDHFNGGGHKNAAGGSSRATMQETLDKFVELFPKLVQYDHD